jgi:hypothetical protein
MTRTVTNGQHVVFVDEDRVSHDALVTTVWGSGSWDDGKPLQCDVEPFNWPACLNIVYVLKDESRRDQYGNQTRHVTSVCHESLQKAAGGYMWRFA